MCRKKAPLGRPGFDRWPKIVHKLAQKCQKGHVSKKGTIGKTRLRTFEYTYCESLPAHFVGDKKLNANVQGGF